MEETKFQEILEKQRGIERIFAALRDKTGRVWRGSTHNEIRKRMGIKDGSDAYEVGFYFMDEFLTADQMDRLPRNRFFRDL
jgi:hypothetical protein